MGARYSRHSGYTISKRRSATRATVRSAPVKFTFGPNTARYFGLGVLAVIAIVVVTQSSTRATSAYQQNDLRQQLGQTNTDIDSLKLEAKRAQSLQNIESASVAKDMQPVDDVTYVEKGDVAGVSTTAPSNSPTP
jgi:TolA-binding protein